MNENAPDKERSVDIEIRAALIKADLPNMAAAYTSLAIAYPVYALQYKRWFDALVDAGFTPNQALYTVTKGGCIPRSGE